MAFIPTSQIRSSSGGIFNAARSNSANDAASYAARTNSAKVGYSRAIPASYEDAMTFGAFKRRFITKHDTEIAARAAEAQKIKEIKENYLPSKGNSMISEILNSRKTRVENVKAELIDALNTITDSMREQCSKYTMTPPSDEAIRMLNIFKMKAGRVSETELNYFLETYGDNYQALTAFQSIAEENGRTFSLPFDPESYLGALETFKKSIEEGIIPNVGTDEGESSYAVIDMISAEEGRGRFNTNAAVFDDSVLRRGVPTPTLYERLQKAGEKAQDAYREAITGNDKRGMREALGDLNRINSFTENNRADLMTDAEKRSELERGAAEAMGKYNE